MQQIKGMTTKELLRKVPFLDDLDHDYVTRQVAESFAANEACTVLRQILKVNHSIILHVIRLYW